MMIEFNRRRALHVYGSRGQRIRVNRLKPRANLHVSKISQTTTVHPFRRKMLADRLNEDDLRQFRGDQVRLSAKHVAEMEHAVAGQMSGEERNCIIVMLGEAKNAGFSSDIGAAY